MSIADQIHFDASGLVPVVVQEAGTGAVVLVAFMNREALTETVVTGEAVFWSRSRQQIWKKGASSGHTLKVARMAINCEQNSVLLTVTLTGPGACHEGYRTCFYREIMPDGTLRITEPQVFDPAEVYSTNEGSMPIEDDHKVATLFSQVYHGYERLRDEDFTATSGTSRQLHDRTLTPAFYVQRAQQEMGELRGVLDGTHRHNGDESDVVLEASQVIYWCCLAAVVSHIRYDDWQPHTVLLEAWQGATDAARSLTIAQQGLNTLLIQVGQNLRQANIHPARVLATDLASLQQRLGEA